MTQVIIQPQPKNRVAPGGFVQLHTSLVSQVDAVSPFINQLMCFISKFRAKDGSELDIELAAHEALVNAIVHGNQLDTSKRVVVTCRCQTDGEVSLIVQDHGNGFDPRCVPDPTAPENHLRVSGRGIHLMKNFMDEVSFEEGGSIVLMRKKGRRHLRYRTGIRAAWKCFFDEK